MPVVVTAVVRDCLALRFVAFWAMWQRTLEFEETKRPEPELLAQSTSLPPPPASSSARPALILPDRQLTYGGTSYDEWPPPEYDPNTITVDRLHRDINGPPHRFVIHRGDTVEVFLAPDGVEIGEVTGISHRNSEVRVAFREGSDGLWFSTEQIFPAVDASPQSHQSRTQRSHTTAEVRPEPPSGLSESGHAPRTESTASPLYTLEEFREFRRRHDSGLVSLEEYRTSFERLVAAKESLQADLVARSNVKQLAALATNLGCLALSRTQKPTTRTASISSCFCRMCWTAQ